MIITTIEELRLHSPAHALDSIDSLVGFIDNSEHDFLEEKLGTPLYQKLQEWYDQNQSLMSQVSAPMIGDTTLPPYNRLCLLAQRCVAFDALGRAIGMQVVSVNNSGVNQMVAEDYIAPDKNGKTIEMYRDTCNREAHAAVNQLLRQLEMWCKMIGDVRGQTPGTDNGEAEQDARDLSPDISAATLGRLLHRLRKVMAALLVGRTSVLKYTKEQKVQAHDDGVRMLQNVVEYIKNNIEEQPAPAPEPAPAPCHHNEPKPQEAQAACWTPPLL